MSLINQMLQDLEKRRASGVERGVLPDQVRVLPREETHSMPKWLVGIAIAVLVIAVFAWQFNRQPLTAPTPVAQAPVQAEPAAPLAAIPQSRPRTEPPPALPRPADNRVRPGSSNSTAVNADEAPPPRKAMPRDSATVAAKEKPGRAPLPSAAVVAAAEPPAVKPPVAVAKQEPAKPQFFTAPTEAPKLSLALPAASAPAAPLPKSAIPPSRSAEGVPDSKAQAALANSQIDKRTQTLSPQQGAENEYREAANLMNQGRLAEAQEGFRQALQSNPAHIGARQGLFGLLLDAKKTGDAEQLLQDGLRLNPGQTGFALALASLQYERGSVNEAIETMQKSAPAARASPDYLARLAGLLQRQSRHAEAIDYYQAALRLAPGSGVWQMGLGISLQAVNRNTEAQDAFRRAKTSNALSAELQAFVDQRLKQLQ
jgi:MSHA biogenesis protein MshN